MKEVVANVPIGAYSNRAIGYYGFAFQKEVLSRIQGVDGLYCLNMAGQKNRYERDFDLHIRETRCLGINTDDVWIDSLAVDSRLVSEVINKGMGEGWIKESYETTRRCSCGLTEVLSLDSTSQARDRSTYSIQNGMIHCDVCDTDAHENKEKVLLMNLKKPETSYINFYPKYLSSELHQLMQNFSEYDLLISRNRKTGIEYSSPVSGGNYNLDPDLYWMFLSHYLSSDRSTQIQTLLTGSRILKQTALILMAAGTIGNRLPGDVIAISKINTDGDKSGSKNISDFINNFGKIGTRAFLTSAIGNRQKEAFLPVKSSLLLNFHFTRYNETALREQKEFRVPSIDQILNGHNHQDINNMSRAVRTGRPLTEYENWLLNDIVLASSR